MVYLLAVLIVGLIMIFSQYDWTAILVHAVIVVMSIGLIIAAIRGWHNSRMRQ